MKINLSSKFLYLIDTPPSSLMDSIVSPKVKTTKKEKVRAHSLACNTSRLERRAKVLGSGLGRLTSNSTTHMDLHKPNNKLINV
jgi:hypothetical protein